MILRVVIFIAAYTLSCGHTIMGLNMTDVEKSASICIDAACLDLLRKRIEIMAMMQSMQIKLRQEERAEKQEVRAEKQEARDVKQVERAVRSIVSIRSA